MVSDNVFTSNDLKNVSKNNFITNIFLASFHFSTNGQVEQLVRMTKENFKKNSERTYTVTISSILVGSTRNTAFCYRTFTGVATLQSSISNISRQAIAKIDSYLIKKCTT